MAGIKSFCAGLILAALCSAAASARPPQELKFKPLQWSPPAVKVVPLKSGATLFLLPDRELPLVNLTAAVRTGTMYGGPQTAVVASLCGALMRAGGTESMRPDDLNETLEFMGASLETSMDTEMAGASLSVLSKDLDRGLSLFADVLMRPRFDAEKLEVEKAKAIESIRRRNDEPFQIARREFRKLVYGPTHPLSRTPEIAMVRKVRRGDLAEFHRLYFRPQQVSIAVAGDFDADAMAAKLESLFAGWKPGPVSLPAAETVTPTWDGRMTVGYARKPLTQASVILGHLGIKRHDPDRFALEVMNEILGGASFTSRLYKEVRSRLGLAYWVSSNFSEPWDYGTIAAGCQTKLATAGESVRAILAEIERMRGREVSAEELKVAKDSIINSFVFRYASSHAIAAQKMILRYHGFADDYLETYPDKIARVTAADVLAAARRYLRPEDLTFLVVGDGPGVESDLKSLGDVVPLDLSIPE